MSALKTLTTYAPSRLASSSAIASARPLGRLANLRLALPSSRSYADKLDPIPRQKYTSKSTNPDGPRYPPPNPTAPPPQSAKAEPDPHWEQTADVEAKPEEVKTTAWDRYLQRGLPNWAIGCMFAYLIYMYGYEKAAQWGFYEGAEYADRAKKMERATARRDEYFAKIEEEKRAAKELWEKGGDGGQKVAGVLLPPASEPRKV